MKKENLLLTLLCLGIFTFLVGCGYNSKGYELSCDHPTKGSHKVFESAGLSKSEYKDLKEEYEQNGYTCE